MIKSRDPIHRTLREWGGLRSISVGRMLQIIWIRIIKGLRILIWQRKSKEVCNKGAYASSRKEKSPRVHGCLEERGSVEKALVSKESTKEKRSNL